MSLTNTAYDAILKERYIGTNRVRDAALKNRTLLGLMQKTPMAMDDKAEGKYVVVPVLYGDPQGASADFATAQAVAAATSSQQVAFRVTPKKAYQNIQITGETLASAKSTDVAFFKAQMSEIDRAVNNLSNKLEHFMFRGGWGKIGTVSTFTGTTITLTNPRDAAFFSKGKRVRASSTESSATLRAEGSNGLVVAGKSTRTGVITFTGTVSSEATSIANGDVLFAKGDREDSATPTRLCLTGFEGWLPATEPSASESFNNVDRSVDDYLYGRYLGASGLTFRDALNLAIGESETYQGKISHVYMHPMRIAQVRNELAGQIEYEALSGIGGSERTPITFDSFKLVDGVNILGNFNCPYNSIYCLDMSTWTVHSRGDLVTVGGHDGTILRARENSDEYEVRIRSFSDMSCALPGANVRIDLDVAPLS